MNTKCGCKYRQIPKGLKFVWGIVHCPLHANAQQTLDALKALGTMPEPKGAYCFCTSWENFDHSRHMGECLAAQKAIKESEAEGK